MFGVLGLGRRFRVEGFRFRVQCLGFGVGFHPEGDPAPPDSRLDLRLA